MKYRSSETAHGIGYPGPVVLILFWTLIGSLAYARHYVQDHNVAPPARMLFEYLSWLTCFCPWVAFAPLVFRAEQRYPLDTRKWPKHLACLVAGVLPLSYVGALLAMSLNIGLQLLFHEQLNFPRPWWQVRLPELGVQFVLYWTTVLGAYVLRSLMRLEAREQQAAALALEKAQLENTLRQAELETLRARLNPHFLFNCLQNVSTLTQEDPKAASQMLARLGTLLRAALRQDAKLETTLEAEIKLTKDYVAVEEIRFRSRLTVLFDISGETRQALVPTFLLQPLVENAIVHGLRGTKQAGLISIRTAIESGNLVLTVADNGIGLPVGNLNDVEMGIGLVSTCQRLEKMYPQQHSFSMRSLPEGGAEVRICLPLHFQIRTGVVTNEQTALVDRG